jgi:hypothetical protein
MATIAAAMSGVPFALQAAATTGNGNVLAIPPSFRNHSFLVKGSSGVSSGAVTIETANDPADTNTWAAIDPIESVANPVTVVASADLMINYSGILNFVRARISTTVVGGTVSVDYEGAKSY